MWYKTEDVCYKQRQGCQTAEEAIYLHNRDMNMLIAKSRPYLWIASVRRNDVNDRM